MTTTKLRAALVALLLVPTSSASYTLKDRFAGSTFFDTFDFFTSPDPTNGYVSYVSQQTALEHDYIGLANHSIANNFIYIGVDHTTSSPASGRESVRITSNQTWTHGLVLIDLYHIPTGCGTWPALWFVAPEGQYPGTTGEIDVVEVVNGGTQNAMTLHTGPGCTVQNGSSSFTGTSQTSNCDVNAPGQSQNSGCSIQAPKGMNATAGSDFNAIGGGTYALIWTSAKIEVYFFARGKAPSALHTTPEPETWAEKGHMSLASFEGCDFDQHVKNLALVINTDFCGGWAGGTWESSGCQASTGVSTCTAFVAGNPKAFEEAYWLIGGVEVWQEG
ncbi:hypothetical protein MBLNU457_g2785t1 [Dothideomycetes sp. NU457]